MTAVGWALRRSGIDVRADERAPLLAAAVVVGTASCAGAVVASAADALFLTRVGADHLGAAFAASSAALVIVLAALGALADRTERARLLTALALAAALILTALAAMLPAAPTAVATVTLIAGKQLVAGVDLAFWVLIAERFDARQARRLVPALVAASGVGTVLGALAVVPLSAIGGARGALVGGAALFALAALLAQRLRTRPVAVALGGRGRAAAARSSAVRLPDEAAAVRPRAAGPARARIGDGWAAVRRSPLALRLALLVAVAGVFAPILYYMLGARAAAVRPGEAELAGFLGGVRAAIQVVTLIAQIAIAPRLLGRAGVARALLFAPIGALVAAAALIAGESLAIVVAAQASARILDAAVQTPAERLAQNLLGREVRGRVAGFLEGIAKRLGAVAGGLLAAALVAWPHALAAITLAVAAAWLAVAWALRRRFAELVVAELASVRGSGRGEDGRGAWWIGPRVGDDGIASLREMAGGAEADAAASFADLRGLERVRAELRQPAPARRAVAIELLGRLGAAGRLDPAAELVAAAVAVPAARRALLEALSAHLLSGSRTIDPVAATALLALAAPGAPSVDPIEAVLALRVLGQGLRGAPAARRAELAARLAGLATASSASAADAALDLAIAVARARLSDEPDEIGAVLDDASRDGDDATRGLAIAELRAELDGAAAGTVAAAARALLRALRRHPVTPPPWLGDGRPAALDALAAAAARGGDGPSAEQVLLRSELRALALRWIDLGPPAAPRVLPPKSRAARSTDPTARLGIVPQADDPATPEVRAAALRLLGAVAEPGDARGLADSLGDGDDEVRRAAAAGLRRLGDTALEALLFTASFGRRPARNGALELLRELPTTPGLLDGIIEAELREVDETSVRLAGLAGAAADGPALALVIRRLLERNDEVAHTLFLVLEARFAEPTIGIAAGLLLRAPDHAARARALEVVDTVLPRALASRVVAALDDGPPEVRAAAAAERLGRRPSSADEAVRAELSAGDPLARALLVDALGRAGRRSHRDAIAAAARDAARAVDPVALLRRLASDDDREQDEVTDSASDHALPSRVDILLALGRVPLFAELTTRQLGELAGALRWQQAEAGEVIARAGDAADALHLVISGRVRLEVDDAGAEPRLVGERGAGEAFDELALFVAEARTETVVAVERTRLARLGRADFEELIEDVPGIALAMCRVLGRRLGAPR